ncbi:tetratricopeptide repeat protein, partial [Chitinimonas sp.]|uniref:protein kinase domain-containing protein n=1 Tax=Chitinimonas sp. TaxID=1934313 RepID=UPI0035B08B57
MPYRYEFGRSTFDESRAELTVNGLTIDIQPQSLRILSILLAHQGEVVTRQELEEQVWFGRFVGDNVLASAITRLRAALGASNAGLIEAIPRIGYRIAVPVQRTAISDGDGGGGTLRVGQPVPGRSEFTLERQLGQSANAEVWLAHHGKSRVERVFKFAPDTGQLAFLKREATLARVLYEHLGPRRDLVQLHDWNFDSAPFFLESDYGGEDLLSWSQTDARLAQLNREERLALFRQIAEVVAAAHSVAVIHKDLKPANILIQQEEQGWQIKLVDFGSGRLTDPERLRDLGLTQLNVSGVNTLHADSPSGSMMYIAPEILRGEVSSERSDVYALGVLLYQLLAGDLRRPMAPGWERDIDDALLREELARATDGDIERRSASVAELLSHLGNLPALREARASEEAAVAQQARDREAARRARQRRPWVIGVIAALSIGLASTLYAYMKLGHSEKQLARQSRNLMALNRFLSEDLIAAASPGLVGHPNPTMKEAIERAASRLSAPTSDYSDELRANLHVAMQSAFIGSEEFGQALQQGELALKMVNRSAEPDIELADDARLMNVQALLNLSRIKEARQQLDALSASLARHGSRVTETQVRFWYLQGTAEQLNYDWEASRKHFAKASELLARLPEHGDILENYLEHDYAESTRLAGHTAEAIALYGKALARLEAKYGNGNAFTCGSKQGLADALNNQQLIEEAIAMAKQAISCTKAVTGEESTNYAGSLRVIANVYYNSQRWQQAADSFEQASLVFAKVYGDTAMETLVTRHNQALSLDHAGQSAKAMQMHLDVLQRARTSLPKGHPTLQLASYYVASAWLDQGQTKGVNDLLDGLDPRQLASTDNDPAWKGLLDYQKGRLKLMLGESAAGTALLNAAAAEIRAKAPVDYKAVLEDIEALLSKVR